MGEDRVRLSIVSFSAFMLLAAVLVIFPHVDAFAQSSLGIGRPEQSLPTGGYFEGFFAWVRSQQAAFNLEINKYLVGIRAGDGALWGLLWVCFLYGVFHAVGPGHGKVVISSYMLANEVQVKRGIVLSFASAFIQAGTAILAVGAFVFALRGSGIKSQDLSFALEMASYVGVMGVGLWLLWRKVSAMVRVTNHTHDHHHHDHHHDHSHEHHHHHDHEHVGTDLVCEECGHSHAPDPSMLEGAFGLKEAWTAVIAVGLRPCTGALIVLVFCFANALYFAGIAGTLAMALGTALSVSAMASLAVGAKNAALRLSGIQEKSAILFRSIEIFGALAIFAIGFVLFSASIQTI